MAYGGEGGENVTFKHKKLNFYFKALKKNQFLF